MQNCSDSRVLWNSLTGSEEITVFPCLPLASCLQNLLQMIVFSKCCVLGHLQSYHPQGPVPALLSSMMPHGLVPRSSHPSAPYLICIQAKVLSLLSSILSSSERQCEWEKSRLAVPPGFRVWETCCKGGLGQASSLCFFHPKIRLKNPSTLSCSSQY